MALLMLLLVIVVCFIWDFHYVYVLNFFGIHASTAKEGRKEEWEWDAKAICFEGKTKDGKFMFSLWYYKPTTYSSHFFSFLVCNFWTIMFLTCCRFMLGFTTKNRRSFHGYKTAKRAFRISKSFITQISWLGDLLFISCLFSTIIIHWQFFFSSFWSNLM